MKSEPSAFSVDDLAQRPGKRDGWDGVRNYQARNYLRSMRRGDLAFLYHSNAPQTGVAGIVQIIVEAYPDPTAFEAGNHHFDPRSDPARPRWYMVDVKLMRKFRRIILLAELKTRRELRGMTLLRPGNRLSVMPIDVRHWEAILRLEGAE